MKVWQATKLYSRLLLRFSKDLINRDFFRLTSKSSKNIAFKYTLVLSQEIKPSETFNNKLFNLLMASEKINSHVLMPNEIFSFWHAVGNPSNQFKNGRTIRNSIVIEEAGGGLCQASGILYLISLFAGLKVTERYNHSVDLYTDETRFAPLGSDATVVYGYKDLRIKNNYTFPVKFKLQVVGNIIKATLFSTEAIDEKPVTFSIRHLAGSKVVETLNSSEEVLQVSTYRNLPSD